MPGFNGKGPLGNGPQSGRGLGFCRRGRRGFAFFHSLDKAESRQFLEDELKEIEKEKQEIVEEIKRLKN